MLLDGEAINLSKTLPIKNALQNFGLEHYYKAKITQTILYVEGSTDIEMLKAFAEWLDHPAKTVLTDKLNYYYEPLAKPQVDTWGYSNSTPLGLIFLKTGPR
ncbi:MAG: hypothetical protein DRR19_02760 [Candidatus Parabeggiatoa sp. nov. 1]|nr:MAG: hypothetical protein DRR19_02760 [Gammaproteobacteria bacterium]